MSVDPARDLVFLPTTSPGPDFFGGLRPGENHYANSLVALRGSTGEVVWHRQLVHHDVWDYDLPAQPILVDLRRGGRTIPAVVQLTKQGLVFVFDRTNGEPVFAIEERPVPQGGVAGEWLSPTQPFPVAPPPLVAADVRTGRCVGLHADRPLVLPPRGREAAVRTDLHAAESRGHAADACRRAAVQTGAAAPGIRSDSS